MIVYLNDFFEITEQDGKVYINTIKPGFLLKDFDSVLRSNPRIKLTNFAVLKNVLSKQSTGLIEIGTWQPNIEIEVSRDKMFASLFVYETADFLKQNYEEIKQQIQDLLKEKGITHGIQDLFLESIVPGKAYLIAQGTPAVKGEDAQVTYLEVPERKPVIREDGKADYYDMNFIFEIKEGSWLGEKIPPKLGEEGFTIYGDILPAPKGKDVPLKYDRKSAYEVEEDGKIILRSSISGVLEHVQGLISVNHHLPISGDIGVETGNIEFEGSVSIRGTVQNGFSVIAKGDISIEGPEGVSGAKLIRSLDGDVFIRGGIFGLGETRVEAAGSIFVKHVNEANLVAGQDINIGFYSIGSNLKAHSILVDERKGKIIGGTAIAKNVIVAAISGNRLERRTELIINSVNKQEAYVLIQDKAGILKNKQEEILQLDSQVSKIMVMQNQLNKQQAAAFEQAKQMLKSLNEEVVLIDQEIKLLMNDLRNAGKEEISITKEAYPGTYIQIGKKSSILSNVTKGKFVVEFGELNI
ncbi:FapA family protein [Solibacillus sp. CAU 1738]|uniref:DUF342 domain-containing protein n=1 Tax=Solibacillus sp. CAU 1738 TaxID=3140363 RepID=UPI0032614EF9